MIKIRSTPSLGLTALLALAATMQPHTASATGLQPRARPAPPQRAQAMAQHRLERAVCLNGQSSQSLQTCLREADAALAQALRADLDDGAANYALNATLRCERLPADQRQDCAARMAGAGTVSGSVAGGGIYRELVTTESPRPTPPKGVAP